MKIQSWDTAFKAGEEHDYSVCTTWEERENGFYLTDLWRGRVEFPELKRRVRELYMQFRPDYILIEDKASGQSLIQELSREGNLPVKGVKVLTDKIARVHFITPMIESGLVYIPSNREWSRLVKRECEEFPGGPHDDIVDSVTQALGFFKERRTGNVYPVMSQRSEHGKRIMKY